MKKFLTLFLLSMIAFNAIHAEITWTLSSGILTISGTEMPDYTTSTIPWRSKQSDIKRVVIENGVTNIGDLAFYNCSNITSITIANSVTNIGQHVFQNCSNLTSVTIPYSVTSIGNYTFYSCKKLKSIIIPESVTSIGNYAFYQCSRLTSISIPNSVTSIGIYAFAYCSGLTSISIPNSVTSIGTYAFDNCSGLTSVTISNSITTIEQCTFYGCSSLTSVTIPNSVTTIGAQAFLLCSGLTSVTIPNSVTSIGNYAFGKCSNLTSVTIPNSVTSIGSLAFSNCSNLTSVNIPDGVASIAGSTFAYCNSLTSINIPYGVTSIGSNAFNSCSGLTSITIPGTVTSIGESTFEGCSSLTSIMCEASIPPDCSTKCFYEVDKSIPVYVPYNSVENYRNTDFWKTFTNIQAIPSKYIVLTDGYLYINSSRWAECEVTYSRTFNNDKWQALYIPFSMSYDEWKDDFDVAYINGIRQLDTNDDNIIDETIMDVYRIESGSLIPNTPYLIRAKTTGEKTIYANHTPLYRSEACSIDCSTTIAKYTFTGTYSTIPAATLIKNKYYAMGGGAIIMTDGESDLKPYRWYMKIEARSPIYNVANAAKTITIKVMGEESETTGVKELQMTNDELPIYDINGRMVSDKSLKPGIYIKNGKKVVIK